MWPVGRGSDHYGKDMVEDDAKRVAAQKTLQAAAEITLC